MCKRERERKKENHLSKIITITTMIMMIKRNMLNEKKLQ